MAQTQTATKTYTRMVFLKIQLRKALRETTNISDDYLDRLMGGVEKQWVKNFSIYGMTENDLCKAELILEIDWSEHNNQIYVGKATVSVDEKWKDDVLIEVDEAIRAFKEVVSDFKLKPTYRVGLTSEVWKDESLKTKVFSELYLSPAEPVKWAGEKVSLNMSNRDFPELGITLHIAE